MPSYLYASDDDLADILSIPESDARRGLLEDYVESASRWIDRETGRRFYVVVPDPLATPVGEARYYTANWRYPDSRAFGDYPWGNPERPFGGGAAAQFLPIDDAVAITEVATDSDGNGTYETIWAVNTDYFVWPRNAALDGKPYRQLHRNVNAGRYAWPPYENGVKVTGSFGYSTLANRPADIRTLCLMVAELMARPIADLSISGAQTYKIGQELSVSMSTQDLPELGQKIVANYKDMAFL